MATITLAWTVLLAGCEPHSAADPGPKFRVTGASPPDSPWSRQWARFRERLAADDSHGLTPELYVRGQLGSPDQTIHNVRRGRIQMGGFPLSSAASLVPEVAVLHAPFLFESDAEIDYLLTHHLQEPLQALFRTQGVTVLQWTEAGWNHLFADRALQRPEDLAAFPMRAQPSAGSRALLGGLGADVKHLPFSELISALQTGMVRGGEATTVMYLSSGLADEAGHLTRTFHAFDAGVILANSQWWDDLSDDQRAAVHRALGSADELRADVRDESERLLAAVRGSGTVRVHDLSPEQRAEWRRHGAALRQHMATSIGGQASDILHALEEGRSGFSVAEAGD